MKTDERPLGELLSAAGLRGESSVPDRLIGQVTDDSRAVRAGALFVAVRGTAADGHRFAAQAVARGAAAILCEEQLALPEAVLQIQVPSTRAALGPLAHAFFGFPSKEVRMLGVTGTKGKSTVTWWIHHLLQEAGLPAGLLGTVCRRLGEERLPSGNTTPGAVELQELLAQMRDRRLWACAMEVSSHALDQNRTDGILWKGAVFTNLAPEHLDYHSSMETYLQAKRRLFESLTETATAVLNRQDPNWNWMREAVRGRVLTYGLDDEADLRAEGIHLSLHGFSCHVMTPQGRFAVRSRMIGRHNLENLLAALGALIALDLPLENLIEGVPSFSGVPGRLERVEAGQPFPIFVDYAHTDGALGRVLEELRAADNRKILTVFGCGGDRDRGKRPRMGRVAAEGSDRVIVTSDNPRSEDPQRIANEIIEGMKNSAIPWQVCLDRREAIRTALELADEQWMVLIAGKGHETQQIFADHTISFDDRAVVRELLGREPIAEPRPL